LIKKPPGLKGGFLEKIVKKKGDTESAPLAQAVKAETVFEPIFFSSLRTNISFYNIIYFINCQY